MHVRAPIVPQKEQISGAAALLFVEIILIYYGLLRETVADREGEGPHAQYISYRGSINAPFSA
jgi:hypothetical protein